MLLRLDEPSWTTTIRGSTGRDHDFAVAWSKMYGKGRVFYSTLGHTKEA